MFKQWLRRIFWGKRILLENILIELRDMHYHADRMDHFYMMVNNIKEEEKTIDKEHKN